MFRNHPPFLIRTITGGPDQGGSDPNHDPKPAGPKPADPKADEDNQSQEAKDFSRALAKRAAEIEAKYADYEDLKAKAAQLDEIEEAKKSEMDKLREQAEQAARERDELKAARERDELAASIAKETGLDLETVGLLAGEGDTLKANAERLKEIIGETSKLQEPKPKLPPANPPATGTAGSHMSPTQLLSSAYADK